MSINYERMGERIRSFRIKKRMTQAVLAEIIEMEVAYICRIERAKQQPSLNALVKIANALGVTIDVLLFGNQPYDRVGYASEWQNIMEGCDADEKNIICSIAWALKIALKKFKKKDDDFYLNP